MLCFAQDDGNVVQWLWIEVLAFQASVVTIFIVLAKSYLKATTYTVEKQPNLIVCEDRTDVDKTMKRG